MPLYGVQLQNVGLSTSVRSVAVQTVFLNRRVKLGNSQTHRKPQRISFQNVTAPKFVGPCWILQTHNSVFLPNEGGMLEMWRGCVECGSDEWWRIFPQLVARQLQLSVGGARAVTGWRTINCNDIINSCQSARCRLTRQYIAAGRELCYALFTLADICSTFLRCRRQVSATFFGKCERAVRRWLQLRFDFDSTIRRPTLRP